MTAPNVLYRTKNHSFEETIGCGQSSDGISFDDPQHIARKE